MPSPFASNNNSSSILESTPSVSTHHNESETDRRCWICLCSGDEPPPMGTRSDAHDWVHPCGCSLVAHRRCLLDWFSEMDLKLRQDPDNNDNNRNNNANANRNDNAGNMEDEENENEFEINIEANLQDIIQGDQPNGNNQTTTLNFSLGSFFLRILGLDSLSTQKPQTIVDIRCPQCKDPIFITIPSSRLVSLKSSLTQHIRKLIKNFSLIITTTSIVGGIYLGVTFILSISGYSTLDRLVPESIKLKIFNVPFSPFYRNFADSLDKNLVPFSKVYLVNTIPIYMLTLRAYPTSLTQEVFLHFFPFIFLNNTQYYPYNSYVNPFINVNKNVNWFKSIKQTFKEKSPLRFLFFFTPLRYAYNIFFKYTFNRVYYKWVNSVRPCFIADRISVDSIREVEREREEETQYLINKEEIEKNFKEEIKQKYQKLVENSGNRPNFLTIIYGKIMMKIKFLLFNPLLSIRWQRFKRELVCVSNNDYSNVFRYNSKFLTLGTTFLWPYFGRFVSDNLLAFIPNLNSFLAKYSETPDESSFVRNLLGCLVVVLLKDLSNLFFTYIKTKQWKKVDVLEFGSAKWRSALTEKIIKRIYIN
ncbi:uncharacterized protein ASCRUDRAFT_9611 [Ascoidea rubescens DSM 1968]|uniref:RING-CH-type domain-containing protein n=1 Tax=Ascoidea rubescens DSM 1968 TaxID=1344418 RepID=A0A1D2VBX9_9ASCO|nr:hypothetical protein ASCRUDRAFT_9611 [Ascoidea rubescens DSM 1968]ODV59214.1 hypothetical protein ASCRUDRAFT_9611 [Ascoidea rubescens DSM 1968]